MSPPSCPRCPPCPVVAGVALQPLAAQAKALTEAMEFVGAPLPEATRDALAKPTA